MDFSDTEYDCVVSSIFDGFQNEKLPVSVIMKFITPYIGTNYSSEFISLRDILDPRRIDSKISREDLKDGLQQWTDNLKSEKLCDIEEEDTSLMSNLDTTEKLHYMTVSYDSVSSDAYGERILELQNEVAEKEHLARKLKVQLELAAQHTQQHEEALSAITLERDQLRSKVQVDQQNNVSLVLLKDEYQYLLDTLNRHKVKSQALQSNLDNLKTENTNIHSKISNLDNEKYALTQMLFKTKEEKEKAMHLLAEAQCNIEVLKINCEDFTEKIQQQQDIIQNLTAIKCSLEIDLQNTINRSSHCNKHLGLEEGSDNEADPNTSLLLTLDNNIKQSEPTISTDVLYNNNIDQVSRYVSKSRLLTSTPRNELSLMQELNHICRDPDISKNSIKHNYDIFKNDLEKVNSSGEGSPFSIYDYTSTDILNPLFIEDELLVIDNTYVINDKKKSSLNNEMIYKTKIASIENELLIEKMKNDNLVEKLNEKPSQIAEKDVIIETLLTRLCNMKVHETLLNSQNQTMSRAIKELKLKFHEYISSERISWLRMQISLKNNLLAHETQTDCLNEQITKQCNSTEYVENDFFNIIASCFWIFCYISKRLLYLGLIFCFSIIFMQCYKKIKYFNVERRGTHMHFYPREWMSIDELIVSMFEFKRIGPTPI